MVELVDEAERAAAQQGAALVRQRAAFLAGDADGAGVGPLQEAGDMQQGRFAGARGTHQRDDLARRQRQVDAVEHVQFDPALAEHPPHPGQFEHAHS